MSSKHLSSGDQGSGNEDARGRAVQRLRAAVAERGRTCDTQGAAAGTEGNVEARASLRAADDHVAARERWLKAVDDHTY